VLQASGTALIRESDRKSWSSTARRDITRDLMNGRGRTARRRLRAVDVACSAPDGCCCVRYRTAGGTEIQCDFHCWLRRFHASAAKHPEKFSGVRALYAGRLARHPGRQPPFHELIYAIMSEASHCSMRSATRTGSTCNAAWMICRGLPDEDFYEEMPAIGPSGDCSTAARHLHPRRASPRCQLRGPEPMRYGNLFLAGTGP